MACQTNEKTRSSQISKQCAAKRLSHFKLESTTGRKCSLECIFSLMDLNTAYYKIFKMALNDSLYMY